MTTYTLAIINGDAGLDVPGDEFGLSPLEGVRLGDDVHAWLEENGADEGDRWVLVTPEPEFRAGNLANLVAWRDVEVHPSSRRIVETAAHPLLDPATAVAETTP